MLLRDPKLHTHGEAALRELASRITDRNYRIFAENGQLHVLNALGHLKGDDPFELFGVSFGDPELTRQEAAKQGEGQLRQAEHDHIDGVKT